jgi:hypothetical protein
VKRVIRPRLGCKSFDAAQVTQAGIERMHIIEKQLMMVEVGDESLTVAQQVYTMIDYGPGRMASWLSA